MGISYFVFLVRSKSKKGYGIHSPFVYELLMNLKDKKKNIESLNELFILRKQLMMDKRIINPSQLGANPINKCTSLKKLIKKSTSNSKKCITLFLLSKYIKPNTILELGTSIGIATIALALGNKKSIIYTIEGNKELADIAEENFKKIGLENINLIKGKFDDYLSFAKEIVQNPMLIFIDGNHNYVSSTKYFNEFIECINENSCIIIDDIHWSDEMEKAWNYIINHPKSTICIDAFYYGLVFYKTKTHKICYKIRL